MSQFLSRSGTDISKLLSHLQEGDWRDAALETNRVMLTAAGQTDGNYYTYAAVVNFPCADLLELDRLWLDYSDRQFGFSIQTQIWNSYTFNAKEPSTSVGQFRYFTERIGWRKEGVYLRYTELEFDIESAPLGHLPFVIYFYPIQPWLAWTNGYTWFFERSQACGLGA
jgi:hypothetical protein